MSGSNPPSTNGSPRLARRALTTSLAALGAVAVPLALVATTGGSGPSALADQADAATSTSFLESELQAVRSLTQSDAVPFQALTTPAPAAPVEVAAPAPAPAPAPTT